MNELVSAIITTYNRFELFKKALNSVQNQTYQNIEIIVIDGSQNEQVPSYLIQYPDIIYMATNKSHPNTLRNLGVDCANGNWVAFLDDDDSWMSEKIDRQIKCFQNNDIHLCYTGKNIINKNQEILKYSYHNAKFASDLKSIMWDNFIGSTSSIAVLKKTIIEVGKFDENFPALQDYDLYIRICQKYKVKGIDKPLISYLNNHAQNQISKQKDNFKKACKLLEMKYKNLEYSSMLIIGLVKLKLKRTVKGLYE